MELIRDVSIRLEQLPAEVTAGLTAGMTVPAPRLIIPPLFQNSTNLTLKSERILEEIVRHMGTLKLRDLPGNICFILWRF